MDEKSLEKAKEIAKRKGYSDEETTKAIEAMEQILKIVKEAWENIKELIKRFNELSHDNELPPVARVTIPPMDTTKDSQVLNRKPMVSRIRSNI